MVTRFAQHLVRWRYFILLAALVVVAAAGYGASKLQLSTDLEVFFHPDDPQLHLYDKQRDTYTHDDNLFFVIAPENELERGAAFSREIMMLVEELTERAWQIPHALRVDSLTNYQHTRAMGDDLEVKPLVENAESLSHLDLIEAMNIALAEPTIAGRLISPDASVTGINITIHLPGENRAKEIPEAVKAARALRDEMKAKYPGVFIGISGKTAGNNAFSESALYDMTHIVPIALCIALGLIAFYIWFASGSVLTAATGTFTTLVIIIAAVACALGMAGWIGYGVTPPMSNSPTMILTLAVADSMHLLVTFFQQMRLGKPRAEAMVESLRINFQAVFLTSVTTAIGFLALNFSDSPPMHDLGNVVAIGVMAAWLFTITLLPSLMLILPVRVHKEHTEQVGAMKRLADWVIANRVLSFVVTGALIVTAASFLPKNELYDVWAEYFSDRTEIRRDTDFLRAHLAGMNSVEFSVGAADSGGITDPEYLDRLEAFAEWLRGQEHVKHVLSFTDIMKRLNKNMHNDDPAWYQLPDERELAAQYLLLYEFSLPFGLDVNNQINLDKSATRLIVSLDSSSTKVILKLQSDIQAWQAENLPEYMRHDGISSDVIFAHLGRRNVISMLEGSTLGLLAISLILALALRSVKYGFISLFANVLPIVVGFGVWGLLVGRIGLGMSIVSGMTMGIVVDYTVHLLAKYRLAKREHGFTTEAAIRYAFSTVGVALFITTVILTANFGLLSFSDFALNADTGQLTAGIILIALITDFFFLPPLLLLLDRKKEENVADYGEDAVEPV